MKRVSFKWFPAIIVIILAGLTFFIFKPIKPFSKNKINAAVVAGFMIPFRELSSDFENKTGIKIEATYSSAGKLYGQVINNAPYDILLADKERSDRLLKEGFAETPFIYARGEVVLWSMKNEFCTSKNWRDALKRKDALKIAIANPETAVYGAGAKKALQDAGLWSLVSPRLINAQDLAQVFQYASVEAVDAGFCALAQAYSDEGKKGCYYPVEEAPVIVHSACVLKRTQNRDASVRFAAYLVSPDAVKIKNKYGYK